MSFTPNPVTASSPFLSSPSFLTNAISPSDVLTQYEWRSPTFIKTNSTSVLKFSQSNSVGQLVIAPATGIITNLYSCNYKISGFNLLTTDKLKVTTLPTDIQFEDQERFLINLFNDRTQPFIVQTSQNDIQAAKLIFQNPPKLTTSNVNSPNNNNLSEDTIQFTGVKTLQSLYGVPDILFYQIDPTFDQTSKKIRARQVSVDNDFNKSYFDWVYINREDLIGFVQPPHNVLNLWRMYRYSTKVATQPFLYQLDTILDSQTV
jgi:hypothetical protein